MTEILISHQKKSKLINIKYKINVLDNLIITSDFFIRNLEKKLNCC